MPKAMDQCVSSSIITSCGSMMKCLYITRLSRTTVAWPTVWVLLPSKETVARVKWYPNEG